jgi:ribosomal-protein-alanine N-acetyltransferase
MVAAEFSGLNPSRYYAAEEDGQIVAYAGIWVIPPEGYITNVAVLPECRRKGIASAVLQKMIDDSLAEGVTDITLEVRVSNVPAIALYKTFGFEEAGVRPRYYQDGEDALIMWRHD